MTYQPTASAPGTWTCPVQLPATDLTKIRGILTELAYFTGWPVNAFLYGTDDAVTELLLYRDPSRTHGTPSVTESAAAADTLTETTGWTIDPNPPATHGILIGLGLREGYEPDAPQHDVLELIQRLSGAICTPARLISTRRVTDTVRWHDEPCAVIQAPANLLPTITELAAELKQERFVVTDFEDNRVYAMQHAQAVIT